MFVLANKMNIDDEGIGAAMLDRNPRTVGVFDSINGSVAIVKKRTASAALRDRQRYFLIPRIPPRREVQWMVAFTREILAGEHPLLARKILKTLKTKNERALSDAIQFLTRDHEGWIHGWHSWRSDHVWEEMIGWFDTLPVTIEDVWESDGCALCMLVQNGPHTIEAFQDAARRHDENRTNEVATIGVKKEQISERVQDDYYYDAMDCLNEEKPDFTKAERLLREALKLDESNVQTHIGLANVYGMWQKKSKSEEYVLRAFEETLKRFPTWPRRLEWGFMENRRFLRAVQWRADMLLGSGEREGAIELYRLLLKLNPNDNQGVRYTTAGVYAGIAPEDVRDMFDEGNRIQNWNQLEKLVKVQNAKHAFWKEPKL